MLRDRSGQPRGGRVRPARDRRGDRVGGRRPLPHPQRAVLRPQPHRSRRRSTPDSWRLLVSGDGVIGDTTYSLNELQSFTSRTYDRALECTGNGRRLFAEQQGTPRPGTQWGLGAIGTARWTGVPLSTVLRHAGLRDDAVQVMGVGLDDPYVHEGENHGRVRRPLPIAKALDDVLIAWDMNGGPLPRDHGYPARLVVPGLGRDRQHQVARRAPGDHLASRTRRGTRAGTACTARAGTATGAVLDRMPVKSTLDAAPDLVAGRATVLRGRAWSGEATIRLVEVSADGGRDLARGHPDRAERAVVLGRLGAALGPRRGGSPRAVGARDRQPGPSPAGRSPPTTTTATSSRPSSAPGHGGARSAAVGGGAQPQVVRAGSAGPDRVSALRVSAIAVALIGIWTCSARSVGAHVLEGHVGRLAGRARGSRRCAGPRPRRTSW